MLLLCLLSCLYVIVKIRTNSVRDTDGENPERFTNKIQLEKPERADCDNQQTFCFTDAECVQRCYVKAEYSCMHGICKNSRIIESNAKNKCDAKQGFIAYLVGNVAFGEYEFICRSVDPGIAVNVDEANNMCLNGDICIDYLKQFPAISNCTCGKIDDICIVPAMDNVRRYVVCDDRYGDLIRRALEKFHVYDTIDLVENDNVLQELFNHRA